MFGLGAVSVATDSDIIAVPGLGPVPGVVGMVAAVAAFALSLWFALRRARPSFVSAAVVALAAALGHLAVLWIGVAAVSGDLIVATVVAGDLVRGGASAVILAAAAIAGWGGIALRRTRSQHPQWPWERDDEE